MHGLVNNLKPRPESKSKTVTATIPYWTCDHMSSTGFYVMMNEDRQLRLDFMTSFFLFSAFIYCVNNKIYIEHRPLVEFDYYYVYPQTSNDEVDKDITYFF